MSNMLDYIVWRGDIPFSAVPVNEVDGLILAQLSMFRWENGLAPGGTSKIRDLFSAMNHQPVSVGFTLDGDLKLLDHVSHCKRFGEIELRDYVHIIDQDVGMQFGAVTLCLDDGSTYVSFRGTDCTLIGWREDCELAFAEPAPSQKAALAYLEEAAGKVKGPLYVGGHSKGGNLAMYATVNISPDIRERIVIVFNHDGPGLSDRINTRELYANIVSKLHSFVPQDSIVGMLLAHPDKYNVIKSDSLGILQHDPYSWQVVGPGFEHMSALTQDSIHFESAIRKWLDMVTESDRKILINSLFDVLNATKSQTFGLEFWQGLIRNPVAVMEALQGIREENRIRIGRMLSELSDALFSEPDDDELENSNEIAGDMEEDEDFNFSLE